MDLCPLCERIKEIRIQQGRYYYNDLCQDCKKIEVVNVLSRIKKKIVTTL